MRRTVCDACESSEEPKLLRQHNPGTAALGCRKVVAGARKKVSQKSIAAALGAEYRQKKRGRCDLSFILLLLGLEAERTAQTKACET